ncbi:hypothetical protein JL193_04500 [Polaribacter batillariae]|uniref:NVEALA protein n=1 Tax=Polaribacter batillariae TaxID=2808900 RepID=A0ABX7SZ35_9FLAO|nr:hypothetical protein [Polaribacter batillariae]QTD38553.1 hypothetical protein JL193_04500 [Polaribacter batillariae]
MKKIIGIIGVVAIAMTVFFSSNSGNKNTDLAGLIAMNTANAESDSNGCDDDLHDQCLIYGQTIQDCDPSRAWHTCSK